MAKLWEDIKKFVKDGANVAAERFEEETTLWKIHREMVGFKKESDKKKMELGGRVYELVKENAKVDLNKDQNIKTLTREIDEWLKKAEEKQKEYDAYKDETGQKRGQKDTTETPKVTVVDAKPVDAEPVEAESDPDENK